MSVKEAINKKDGSDGNKNKKKEGELFIPNSLETESRFRVACSLAVLILFFTTMNSNTRQPGAMLSRTATSINRHHYHTYGSKSC
jgi:hypothetical protein